MRLVRWIIVLAAVLPSPARGNDCASEVLRAPWSATNGATRQVTFGGVRDAASYNLYMKTVHNCDELEPNVYATTSDPQFANVTSPFDISSFNVCRTCYYYGVSAVRGDCESELVGGGFMLLPCS